MNWGEVLQALLLLLAGSGITLLTGALGNRRRAREVAVERELEEKRRRSELGRSHALEARRMAQNLDALLGYQDFDAERRGDDGHVLLPDAMVNELEAEIYLIPDATLRENAHTCLSLLRSEKVYMPPKLREASTRDMILLNLIENLEEFIREEPIDHESLSQYAAIIHAWHTSDNFH